MTDYVKDYINQQREYLHDEVGNPLAVIDTESNPNANKHMPVMDDLILKLGLTEDQIKNPGAFFNGHHGRYPTSFATFRHKIQDNMPVVLIEGRLSDRVPFLISRENMKSMRSLYN